MKQPNKLELYHHGVLGQRWGVRRTESQLARGSKGTASSKKDSSKETEKSKIKSMSDAELRQKINRIQMEKQYSELSAGKIKKGQRVISKILTNSVKTAVSAIIVVETSKAIRKILS